MHTFTRTYFMYTGRYTRTYIKYVYRNICFDDYFVYQNQLEITDLDFKSNIDFMEVYEIYR